MLGEVRWVERREIRDQFVALSVRRVLGVIELEDDVWHRCRDEWDRQRFTVSLRKIHEVAAKLQCLHQVADGQGPLFLPIHNAFKASRKKRQIIVAHRRGRKTSMALEKMFQYLWANPKIVGKTLAPERKQAKEIIWDDPDMLFHQNVCNPSIIRNINKSELKITLKNGSVWSLDGADDPHSKRGGNVKVLHLTEAGDHDEAVWSAVYEPVLMANGGVAIFEGNPRGKNWYFRLTMDAKTRPNWDVFEIPAAREMDNGSLELVTPIFTLADLEDLRAHTPDAVFRRNRL